MVWKTVKLPITCEVALKQFSMFLSSFETTEILGYSEIFYMAHSIMKAKLSTVNNSGFDDDKGDYRIIVGDHICFRYEIKSLLGKGSFGQVVKVFDHKEKIELAVKIIKNRPRFHQQALEEIEILTYLKDKDPDNNYSIVHIKDHFTFRKHAILIFELLSIDLYQFIKLTKFQGLSQHLIRKFALQVLQALRLCDRYKIIHCDLKPENILLTSSVDTNVKVIDFGSACFYEKRMYTYIQSRFYRAPEIILGLSYTTSIDIWSFGCILVELYTGRPLFPGENEAEQIQCMMEVLGIPDMVLLRKGTRVKLFFDDSLQPKIVQNSKGKKRIPGSKSLNEILIGAEEGFIDLVRQCLEWDYHKRISPDEALLHEWMQEACPTPTSKRRLKHTRTTSDTSFLKIPQRFDKLSNYIEGPAGL
jgi:dual specificity tyrosine-phosphorylation-regulated kinase 2/3/4